jgi:hypothetical protein
MLTVGKDLIRYQLRRPESRYGGACVSAACGRESHGPRRAIGPQGATRTVFGIRCSTRICDERSGTRRPDAPGVFLYRRCSLRLQGTTSQTGCSAQ